MNQTNVGKLLWANFYGVSAGKFDNQKIKEVLKEACIQGNCMIVNSADYTFYNGGYTITYILAESHAALHTYPERNEIYTDIFVCGKTADPLIIFNIMNNYFSPMSGTKMEIIER